MQFKNYIRDEYDVILLTILAIVPLVISFSLIIGTGPYIQQHAIALLHQDAPTIYGTAYGDAINNKFPSLRSWFAQAFHWSNLLMSSIIITYSLNKKLFRRIVISLWASTAAVLSVGDLIILLIDARFTINGFSQNVVANIIGGAVAALVFSTILLGHKFFVKNDMFGLSRIAILASCLTLIAGFFASMGVFYISKAIYRPVPVKIDGTFSPSISGYLAVEPDEEPNDENIPFKLLTGDWISAGAEITSPKGISEIDIRTDSRASQFDVKITLLDGCSKLEDFSGQSVVPKHLEFLGLSDFRMGLDAGYTYFSGKKTYMRPGFLLSGPLGQFWIRKNDETKAISVQRFLQNEDAVTIEEASEYTFLLSGFLLKVHDEGKGTKRAKRRLSIHGNENEINHIIDFIPTEKDD